MLCSWIVSYSVWLNVQMIHKHRYTVMYLNMLLCHAVIYLMVFCFLCCKIRGSIKRTPVSVNKVRCYKSNKSRAKEKCVASFLEFDLQDICDRNLRMESRQKLDGSTYRHLITVSNLPKWTRKAYCKVKRN